MRVLCFYCALGAAVQWGAGKRSGTFLLFLFFLDHKLIFHNPFFFIYFFFFIMFEKKKNWTCTVISINKNLKWNVKKNLIGFSQIRLSLVIWYLNGCSVIRSGTYSGFTKNFECKGCICYSVGVSNYIINWSFLCIMQANSRSCCFFSVDLNQTTDRVEMYF